MTAIIKVIIAAFIDEDNVGQVIQQTTGNLISEIIVVSHALTVIKEK